MEKSEKERAARWLRWSRKVHRAMGVGLFVFFVVVAVTGLLLGWKKNSGGVIYSKSHKGSSTDMKEWLPVHILHDRAVAIARSSISPDLSPELDRIDFRPDKGMVKFVFVQDYWGIQLDCATGELLHIEKRRSDFIENLHDGSLFDRLLKTNGEPIKLGYSTVTGVSLLGFTATGFWLWYGPKRMRAAKQSRGSGEAA